MKNPLSRTLVFVLTVVAFFIMVMLLAVMARPLILAFMNAPSHYADEFRALGITLAVLAALGVLIPLCRFLCLRASFHRRLKRICRERGFELSRGKGTLVVRTSANTYSCVLVPTLRRHVPLLLGEEGHAYAHIRGIRTLGVFRARDAHLPMRNRSQQVKVWEKAYMFAIAPTRYFTFPKEGFKKILIAVPPARRIVRGTVQQFREVDNGEEIEDYTVYTGGAFCNLIDRETDAFHRNYDWARKWRDLE